MNDLSTNEPTYTRSFKFGVANKISDELMKQLLQLGEAHHAAGYSGLDVFEIHTGRFKQFMLQDERGNKREITAEIIMSFWVKFFPMCNGLAFTLHDKPARLTPTVPDEAREEFEACLNRIEERNREMGWTPPRILLSDAHWIDLMGELRERIEHLRSEPLPDLPEYTPAFFAARHECSQANIRKHFASWQEKHGSKVFPKDGKRWRIEDKVIAQRFDDWMRLNRRGKGS
jgi:hypothetical protein